MGKKTGSQAHLGITLMRDRFKGQRILRDKDGAQGLVCIVIRSEIHAENVHLKVDGAVAVKYTSDC